MKFKDIFFLSVFSLFIGIQCLRNPAKVNHATISFSRMKSKSKFHSQAEVTSQKFNNMAYSMRKLQELSQLHQNISHEIQAPEEGENPQEQLLFQIKSLKKQIRLTQKILKATEILTQNAKTNELKKLF